MSGFSQVSHAFIVDTNELNSTERTEIGSGTYATVYKVTYKEEHVVVKELQREILVDQLDETINKSQELRACHDLSHPSIVKFLGYSFRTFPDDDERCKFQLVFEYFDGSDLKKILGKEGKRAKTFELGEHNKHEIAIEVANAIDYLHGKKIIHGDIKPANILITKEYKAKVCDFGLSKLITESSVLMSSLVQPGTKLYMAPELFLQTPGARRTPESDIFSFGATMHELFFGNNLFGIDANSSDAERQLEDKYIEELVPLVSQKRGESELHAIIADCVQYRPSCRPKALEVLQRLQKCKPEQCQ